MSVRVPPSPTPRQRAVLNFVVRYSAANGRPPTLREIGLEFGIRSTNGVKDHLIALERKGLIARDGMVSRGLRVLPAAFGAGTTTYELADLEAYRARLARELAEVDAEIAVRAGRARAS